MEENDKVLTPDQMEIAERMQMMRHANALFEDEREARQEARDAQRRAARREREERQDAECVAQDARDAAKTETAYERQVALGSRQAQVTAACLEQLESLAHGSQADEAGDIDDARDHVLRALRAHFFARPETPLERLLPTLMEQLPNIMAIAGIGKTAEAPSAPSSCCPSPFAPASTSWTNVAKSPPASWAVGTVGMGDVGSGSYTSGYAQEAAPPASSRMRPGDIVSTPLGLMIVTLSPLGLVLKPLDDGSQARPASSTTFTASPDGSVTPPSEPEPRVKQYWDSIVGQLDLADLDAVLALATMERHKRLFESDRVVIGDSYAVAR